MLYIEGFFITCKRIIQNEQTMSQILDLTGKEILSEFGKGIGMPGSGSVAALSVLSGTHLLISVCKLTLSKDKYKLVHDEISEIQTLLQNHLPNLERILNDDGKAVKNMVRYRMMRDKEDDPNKKKELAKLATDELEKATDTTIGLCDTCLEIIPLGLQVFRVGQQSAKGDSAVAVNTLLSGAFSGLYMTLLNIELAKNASWTRSKRSDLEKFFGRLHEYQYILSGKLAALYNNT